MCIATIYALGRRAHASILYIVRPESGARIPWTPRARRDRREWNSRCPELQQPRHRSEQTAFDDQHQATRCIHLHPHNANMRRCSEDGSVGGLGVVGCGGALPKRRVIRNMLIKNKRGRCDLRNKTNSYLVCCLCVCRDKSVCLVWGVGIH